MANRNGYFEIVLKEEGTYIKLYPPLQGGVSLTYDIVAEYLNAKRIMDYDIKMLGDALAALTEPKEIRLNFLKGSKENEFLSIRINKDRTEATGIFYPPTAGGTLMTKQDIISDLVRVGIKFGVEEETLDKFLENRQYCTEMLLAKSVMPVQGKNAQIHYTFLKENSGKPRINEDGSVDFHQLDMISHVSAGDVLATLTPVDYGKPGLDIFGNVIKQAKVNSKVLKHGKNIHLSEDKLTMYSDVSGHATFAEDKVFVSDVYEVPADVGVASGDIEYDGNVLVRGNVITGFTIKAKGDIIVKGIVEGATLIADGQIILERGIQGKTKGKLISKGNITARFLESCEAHSQGEIFTDAIMNSTVSAKGDITVTGKKGLITGSTVKSGTGISAKTIGSPMCIQTFVTIGIDDAIVKECAEIEKAMEDAKTEMEQLIQSYNIIKKRLDSGLPLSDAQKLQAVTAKKRIIELQDQSKRNNLRYTVLKSEVDNFKGGRIKFTGNVYPEVVVEISASSMRVKQELKYGQFVRERGDIRIIAI